MAKKKKEEEILDKEETSKVEEISQKTEDNIEKNDEPLSLEGLQKKYDELNDRYLRTVAEYDNFRKRTAKEQKAHHAEAVSYAVKALLPVYDNLERAVKQESSDDEYKKGVEMIMKQFKDCFNNINVTEIDISRGSEFDPNIAEAMMHIEDEDLGENQISQVFQKGFKIGDKVIRHSVVQVAN